MLSPASKVQVPRWYTIAWVLALPAVALYLCWRSLRQPEYRRHWAERFLGRGARAPADSIGLARIGTGTGAPIFAAPISTATITIWVHAVSVGETRAAQPLVEELARAHPGARFVLTHMTPTGRAAGADWLRSLSGRAQQRYLPYDLPFAVRRFLREVQPRIGILMETEIWPSLLHAARDHGVPIVLANARLSQRSLEKALRHERLIRAAAACICVVGAQSPVDRERIARLYEGPIEVTGNCKFDLRPDAAQIEQGVRLRAALCARFGARPLWLFASTREGEERLVLDALAAQGAVAPVAGPSLPPLLLFVPRHPQRFAEVAALLHERGAGVLRRAQWEGLAQQAKKDERPEAAPREAGPGVLLLGDSMGEMPLYYAMADAALIGGSVLALGGQNLIEACACGCPVVLGPHMFNFAQAADDAVAAGAARRVRDVREALQALAEISSAPPLRQRMAQAALAFCAAHRGATARMAGLIDQSLARSRDASCG